MKIKPVHPGLILLEEFLEPLNITQYRLTKDLNVPLTRIAAIVKGERSIRADTALRLARYFEVSKDFWVAFKNAMN
jgi:addiction module HigA family antidote